MIFFDRGFQILTKKKTSNLYWNYCCLNVTQPRKKSIYALNVEPKQQNSNGLIGVMKIMLVNKKRYDDV